MESEKSRELLEIRTIRAEDADEVARLTVQLGYERTPGEIRRWIGEMGADAARQAAFVACLGAEVVAWVEVSLERHLQSEEFALIGGLVVRQGYRGLGIGKRLCERAEAWGWEQGVAKVRVTSRSTRAEAHRFYIREGYELVKTSLVFEKKRQ